MSDQPATSSEGQIFRAMTTLGISESGHGSLALPTRFAELLDPPMRKGDLGTYHGWPIVRVLGRGGMGLVLQSYDQKLRRDVALKTMLPEQFDDAQMAARFAREARVTAQINHPNVITIYSVHEESHEAFLVMELLQGGTLMEWLRDRPVTEHECVRIARDIAQGLQAAHELGLLHRDLKPSNIGFRRLGGQALIMDFGLARTVCDTDPLTLHGTPLGTPAFMSPEQVQVKKLDQRSDLFSLGTVMYLMISGELPFQGGAAPVICHSITLTTPKPLRKLVPGISPGLESIIVRLLQKNPAHRFQTATQLIDALNQLSLPAAPRRMSWLAASALVAASLAVGGYMYWNANQPAAAAAVDQTPQGLLSVKPEGAPDSDAAPAATTPPPEIRDSNGVTWRSTNREHAGTLSADEHGVVQLVQSGTDDDEWSMVEILLEVPADAPHYLLLDVLEVSPTYGVEWAIKLAPRNGAFRDIELTYHRESGRFAIHLPSHQLDSSNPAKVRLFVIGSDGAFVRLRDVRIATSVPTDYQELPALSTF